MKKLSEQEINQLFDFTKKHFVDHYDVQVELVDHLANAIEMEWETNPAISFSDALDKEFKKFGIFGFSGLVEQKQSELIKYYNKILWTELLKFVSIPKIIITVFIYFMTYFFLQKRGDLAELIISVLLLLSLTVYLIYAFLLMAKIKKEQKKEGKSWLLQSVATQVLSLPIIQFSALAYPLLSHLFSKNESLSELGIYFFVFFVVLQIITIYVFMQIVKPRIMQAISDTQKKYQYI